MTVDDVSMITQEALMLIIKVSAPVLIISLVVGLLISIFQTVTSIQEQTLTFVPKILSIFITLMIMGSWLLNTLTGYMTELWSNFSYYLSMG